MNLVKEYGPVIGLTFALVFGLRTVIILGNSTGNTTGY